MHVITFDSIDSTNNYLKIHHQDLPHFTVVRARYQSAGRGQLSRQWISNPNENLLVSFLFKDIKSPLQVQSIEKIAISLCISFFKAYGIQATHKLPNDILVDGKKIAGMLIETKQMDQAFAYVILGIGININQKIFTGLDSATSLHLLTRSSYDIDEVFRDFLEASRAFETM